MQTPDVVVEAELDRLIGDLESNLEADVLTYIGPLRDGSDIAFRDAVERLSADNPNCDRLYIVLQTGGGSIDVAERIVNVVRQHYGEVSFIVPNFAYSAGTILAMSGDAIWMDYFSVLGPIDPQVKNQDGNWVPALGYLERYMHTCQQFRAKQICLNEFIALIKKFDDADLYFYFQARELSIDLLKDWLAKYKFKNWTVRKTSGKKVTANDRVQRAEEVAQILCDASTWHSHSRGIPIDVLEKKVRLKIDDFGKKPKLKTLIRAYDRLTTSYMQMTGAQAALHTRLSFMGLGIR